MKRTLENNSFCYATVQMAADNAKKFKTTGELASFNELPSKALSDLQEFDGIASSNQGDINHFTTAHQLEPVRLNKNIAVLGYFKFASKWKYEAKRISVFDEYANGKHKYADMKAKPGFDSYTNKYFNIVFALPTQSKYTVWLGDLKAPPTGLIHIADKMKKLIPSDDNFNQLRFPFIYLKETFDLDFLKHGSIGGQPINTATQTNMLKLDNKGVKAESETRITTKGKVRNNLYAFNKPFLIWIMHKDTGKLPLFVTWADKSIWVKG